MGKAVQKMIYIHSGKHHIQLLVSCRVLKVGVSPRESGFHIAEIGISPTENWDLNITYRRFGQNRG
jgi:hypothetical protein